MKYLFSLAILVASISAGADSNNNPLAFLADSPAAFCTPWQEAMGCTSWILETAPPQYICDCSGEWVEPNMTEVSE